MTRPDEPQSFTLGADSRAGLDSFRFASDAAGCEGLDDVAKDHISYSDRHAEDSGQNKVQTADDRCHGSSLGNESTSHVLNTHECNNYKVTFGTRAVQLPSGQAHKPQTGENDPVYVNRCRLRFTSFGLEGMYYWILECNFAWDSKFLKRRYRKTAAISTKVRKSAMSMSTAFI